MLSIIITAFNEPLVEKTIFSILNQTIEEPYELIIAAPDKRTKKIVKELSKTHQQLKYFKDPGKGKVFALNQVFKITEGRILILTDGDLYLGNNSINEIIKKFENPKVGCVSGRPMAQDDKNTLFGYWAHFLYDIGAHKISRKKRYETDKFLECSGYLYAFRNNIISKLPLDVAEDSITPYLFWKKGYKIAYAENSLVYVKNPTNMHDFIKQRKRAADSHTKLKKYAPDFPKVKTLKNEILEGLSLEVLKYPKNPKELIWTLALYPVRLYIWLVLFFDLKFKKKEYQDGWERSESTKI
ncbi:MAG: glycosyltransferase [Nanoarchaeota archaeon]|nr:glycosyltransferase [Nanoarchaeota archaeon]MBU1444878.1 glycosyltransferase [Nanoarchaeota archaeon]MBU2420676.1 glycosyltransferase [Nanoarchaeota archaeon]MBU2475508.1 glycosyltransferase [Nanoarchaeota archaeon]